MTGQKDPEILVCRGGEEEGLEQTHRALLISSLWQRLQAGSSNVLHLGVVWDRGESTM